MKPGTALLSADELFLYVGRNPTAMSLNLSYPQPRGSPKLAYWFVELAHDIGLEGIPQLVGGKTISMNFRNYSFTGSSLDGLAIYYEPDEGRCLWVLSPEDEANPEIPALAEAVLPVSNLSRIEASPLQDGYPPVELFGKEPTHTWCYYFQKAELARQLGDSPYSLDVATIKNIQEQAAAKELADALSVYDGELLPGFYDDCVLLEREHIQSVYEQKMVRLISLLQDEQRWQDVLTWGEKWISLGQKPESAYRALMSAHAAKSDMSKVVAVYERCVRSLKEFGIEPSEQTIRLYERLKSGQGIPDAIPTLTLNQVPAKKEAESHPSNLPVPLTSFIGREKEDAPDIIPALLCQPD